MLEGIFNSWGRKTPEKTPDTEGEPVAPDAVDNEANAAGQDTTPDVNGLKETTNG